MDKRDGNGKPFPFSMQFITVDLQRKTGGKRVIVEKGFHYTHDADRAVAKTIAVKDPHEGQHVIVKPRNTRNIMIVGKNHPVSVHIRLIEKFNGAEVLY